MKANAIWKEKYASPWPPVLLEGCTYLFEILYPENRIVVDYGKTEDLILLDVIDVGSGLSIGRESVVVESANIGCPVVESYDGFTADHLMNGIDNQDKNREGLVISFADGSRVKLKLGRILPPPQARHWGECSQDLGVPDEWQFA